MSYFKWNDDYKVGNQVIDYQHRRLMGLVNDLYEIQKNEDFHEKLVEVIIEELKHYAKFHFRTEEEFLKEANYPEIKEHQKLHHAFERELDNLFEQRHRYEDIAEKVFNFLCNWLEHHIKVEDKKMMRKISSSSGLV